MAHEEEGCAAHGGGGESATEGHEGTLLENAGDVPAAGTSVHRQGQDCPAFQVEMNCFNLMWKGNKRRDLGERSVRDVRNGFCFVPLGDFTSYHFFIISGNWLSNYLLGFGTV